MSAAARVGDRPIVHEQLEAVNGVPAWAGGRPIVQEWLEVLS
ncbi:hypothetical protein KZZ52_31430 [Dactylosporangium sp. AC04546]|nr:hypothetical protein [Dactylosporangium sp. AC04546]WVK78505.1 hypothetical protein KZZ52_31430 [Dactylosporangium sp. AC04546]